MSASTGGSGTQGLHAATTVEAAELRIVLGHFATGVVIVTGTGSGGPAGLTCQSFFSLSLDPPLVAVAPARTSSSWPAIHESGAFCINVLAAGQEALARGFARSGGDKFTNIDWGPTGTGSPRLDGVLAWIDCRLMEAHDGGDHHLIVGRILEMGTSADGPLLFYRGAFGTFQA
ncbi:MAG: flavin reductase family protein [Actinomycetota bacterium]|nr:flavin reductase family protein [Actinomycetota bacterium]